MLRVERTGRERQSTHDLGEIIKDIPILKSYPADNDKEVKSRVKEIEKLINSILDQNNRKPFNSALTTTVVSDEDWNADCQACAESSTKEFSMGITRAGMMIWRYISINNSPSENENKEEIAWVPMKHHYQLICI